MHEWALAEGVVATALEEAERQGLARIEQVDVAIGQLQQISRDVFEFALSRVMPAAQPRLDGTRFELSIEPAAFRCRACGHEFPFDRVAAALGHEAGEAVHFIPELAHVYIQCPECESPDFEVARGRGVAITGITGSRA